MPAIWWLFYHISGDNKRDIFIDRESGWDYNTDMMEKKGKLGSWFALLTGICLLASGCAAPAAGETAPTRFHTTFVGAMDTVVNLTAYCATSAQFDAAARAVRDELERLEAVYSVYRADSVLARVNAGAGGPGVAASDELISLIERCRVWQTETPGVNIAMGGVLRLWHTARETGVPPADGSLREAGRHCAMADVMTRGDTVILRDAALSLDLGAVAKGAVAGRAAARLRESGIDTFLLDCGTSTLVCAGAPPGKEGWTVALRNPDALLNRSGDAFPPDTAGTVALRDRCLSMSGDYQQYFVYNGTYYSHIIEENTGLPAAYVRAVCVLAADAARADYYSTALFTHPYAEGRRLADAAGIEALWFLPDGTRRATDGFPPLA